MVTGSTSGKRKRSTSRSSTRKSRTAKSARSDARRTKKALLNLTETKILHNDFGPSNLVDKTEYQIFTNLLDTIQIGTAPYNRAGNEVYVEKIKLRFHIETKDAFQGAQYRVMIGRTNEANQLSSANAIRFHGEPSASSAPQKYMIAEMDKSRNYPEYDKIVQIGKDIYGWGYGSTLGMTTKIVKDVTLNVNKRIKWEPNSGSQGTGTTNKIMGNNWWFLAVYPHLTPATSAPSGDTAKVTVSWEIYFKDV